MRILLSSSYGCQIFSTEVTSETQGTWKAKLRCVHCCLIITSFIGLQGLKETYICMETNSIPLWQVSDLEFNIDICLVLTDLSRKQFTMPRNYIHIPLVSLPIIHNSNFSVIALWKFRPISPWRRWKPSLVSLICCGPGDTLTNLVNLALASFSCSFMGNSHYFDVLGTSSAV